MKTYIYILLICSFFNCNEKENRQEGCSNTITVNTKNVITDIAENSLIEDIKLVPLLKGKKLINNVGKLKIVNNVVFVSDRNTHGIYFFSLDGGNFIGEINSRGKGPGEYFHVQDFYINKDLRYIEVLDAISKKIFRYNLKGEFLSFKEIPYNFVAFSKINDENNFVFSKDIVLNKDQFMYQLFITDKNLNILEKHIRIEKNKTTDIVLGPRNSMQPFDDIINFQPIYNPIIYSINKDLKFQPRYCLDFSGSWLSDELAYNHKKLQPLDYGKLITKSGKAYFIDFLEGNKNIIIYFNMKMNKEDTSSLYINIYNKLNNTSKLYRSNNSSICLGNNKYLTSHNGYFASIKQPYELKQYLSENPDKVDDELKSIILQSYESGAPLLLLTKFK